MSALKALPTALPWMLNGLPDGDCRNAAADIVSRVRPGRKPLTILSPLATGHLPWGVHWPSGFTRHGNRWVLCCGVEMNFETAARFVRAGLLVEIRRLDGEEALAITDAGRVWLAEHWPR